MNTAFAKGYRTIVVNVLIAVGASLAAITDKTDIKTAITIVVIAAINAALRSVTDTPVGSKGGGV